MRHGRCHWQRRIGTAREELAWSTVDGIAAWSPDDIHHFKVDHDEILLKRFSAPRNSSTPASTPAEAELPRSSNTEGTDADKEAVSGSEDENSDDGLRPPTDETFGEAGGGEDEG